MSSNRKCVTVTLAANMRGGMWTQIVYEGKSDRLHPHGPLFPRQLVSHSPTHWITLDALLDMIDAIDTDMNARPGGAEQIPWLLVLDCAPQHVAKEFRSIMRDTRPHIKLCYVQRNFTAYTQPLDRAYMRAFMSSIRSDVAKHFAEFFLEAESNFERATLDSSTSVLRQLLLSFVHTAAQNADSPQHRAAGWRFIDWNEVEQRELLAEAKRLLETGELFPRGTAEEPHAPDAEAEATDSEPKAHVMEPLADDHSSNSVDAPTGVEESAAPAAPAVAAAPEREQPCLRGCKQSVSYTVENHQLGSTLPLCRAQKESCGGQSGTRSQGISSALPARACMSVSSASISTLVGSERVVVSCCFPVHQFLPLFPCVFTLFASSIACTQNGVKMTNATAINAVPILEGGSPRRHHWEWSSRLN